MVNLSRGVRRRIIQILTAIGSNSYFEGFVNATIYKGKSKAVCAPFLNCYSCPGARLGCPIGSLQAVMGNMRYKFSFYVIGFMMLMGILLGRLICGILCPFGFIQDMLYKIPTPKFKVPKILKFTKYLILIFFVILFPILLTNDLGMGDPYFCKYLCPAGTLEGGIVLVSSNPGLQQSVGWLFNWKLFLVGAFILSSIFFYRPFCKVICPLGAFYALFNKISFYKLEVNDELCINCGKCSRTCKMDVDPSKTPNHSECIRCGECISACPTKAITTNLKKLKKPLS